jgi:protein ImuB
MNDGRRQVVAAADRVARTIGLFPGMPVAQAQAMVPGLLIAPSDPDGDARGLADLAAWCLRYAPLTASDRPDGVWIDATGVTHPFAGEAVLLDNIVEHLARRAITARAAIADTPGAAWAAARYGERPTTVVPVCEAAVALRPLPLIALRLPEDILDGLSRVGFERVEQLMAVPRGPATLRFGPVVMLRLDQALGRVVEPIEASLPPEAITCRLAFPEPLLTREALAEAIRQLTAKACVELERQGQGARRLDLMFERVDRTDQLVCVGTARPNRHAAHLAKLLDEQLQHVDPGFGVEAIRLSMPVVEPLAFSQTKAKFIASEADAANLSVLVDRLANRLGTKRLYRAAPVESDVPERSVRRVAALSPPSAKGWPKTLPRPARLLKRPQPVQALAMLPDHPPAQFVWRRRRYRIRRADGPERIAGEWWKRDCERCATRDYWQVEDEQGRRFWLYRSGDAVDPATGDLRWFLHGFF